MHTHRSENILMTSFHTNYSNKKTFFVVFNQINKYKATIYNHRMYTKIIINNFYFFSLKSIRMSGNSINFDDRKIKINDFYKNKNKKIFNIDSIDVDKILVSKKVSYGKNNSFKYFIGYNDNVIIRPLFVKLHQMTSYINKFKDKKTKITTTTMSLMVKDKQPFKNYNKIWEKIESLMRKKFDSKLFYGNDDNKYIKTKIKTFKDSIITNFHNKKVPEEKIPYKCLLIIALDSVIKTDNKYYPQTFLEECIYKQQKQQNNYITEELESHSDSNNESESESDSDSNDDETKSDIDNDE